MTPPRAQMLASMTTRQKVTAVIFIVILLFLLYQIYAMLGGGSTPPKPASRPQQGTMSAQGPGGMQSPPRSTAPMATSLPTPQPVMTQRELELLRLQQETEAKYITALNELQMLRIDREIAETNKAIMSAKLDTITSQKSIVDLLKPPVVLAPGGYAQGLITPVPSGTSVQTTTTASRPIVQAPPTQLSPPPQNDAAYTVISVSQLQSRWSAVLGFQGNLFSVYIGDFLPPDQSKVLSIDRSGVTLERNGIKRKVSLVPII